MNMNEFNVYMKFGPKGPYLFSKVVLFSRDSFKADDAFVFVEPGMATIRQPVDGEAPAGIVLEAGVNGDGLQCEIQVPAIPIQFLQIKKG